MKPRDLKIGTQLRLGLGAILGLVVLLGASAWLQADRLWQETQGLYEHPLATRRAVGELNGDILIMERGMDDLFQAKDDLKRQACLQSVDTGEADAHRQLDVLFNSYLGPRKDVDDVVRTLSQWKAIREENLRLLRAGQLADAASRAKSVGAVRTQAESILTEIDHVSKFALAKGEQFYENARLERDHLLLRLWILLGAILLLSMAAGFFLLRGIKNPLQELTATAEQYRQGKLEVRARYASRNEFGALATAFNQLAETVQAEMRRKEKVNRIAEVMLREQDLRAFCQQLLAALLEDTGSQVGAVYLLNERRTEFEHFESIGLGGAGRASFSATGREGEFGAALASRQIQRITALPADTRFKFAAVSGDFVPREIITIPLVSETEVAGVISLASLRDYPEPALQLVRDVFNVMTARMNGVLAFRQIREISGRLEIQNRELESQKRELDVQASELREQNLELEMQKKELDEASRLKSAFLSNMSHELRTPLNSVIALSSVLSRRLRGTAPPEEHGYLEVIERNGKQLLTLINDILDLSRIESGKEEFSLGHFSAHELAAEVVATLEPQAREKNLALRNLVPADLPALKSDYAKCRHILQNLVGNAVKFTPAGHVEIAAAAADGGLRLSVADTGIGIAAEHLSHIFDEFRQADETTSRKYGGTGLGLAIAKKYATLLRGQLTVESTPGKGSIFSVTLPLTLALPAPGGAPDGLSPGDGEAPAGAKPIRPAGRAPVILLVEDSEPAVIQITDILTEQGYEVRVARNGQEALDQIAQTPPDAMILDLMMPGVDGFQVLRVVRGAEPTARLPVVILTAKHITREELSFLKGNHIRQLIQKGDISKAELLAAVAKMVGGAELAAPPAGPDSPAPPPRPARALNRPAGKPLILVVEDHADNLKTVRALLEDFAVVREATSGPAGLEQARANPPDLILLDIALPGMDGFATLEAIRREETLRHLPVIALTARAMKGDREHILGRGFDGYVSKPIEEPILKATIHHLLHGS